MPTLGRSEIMTQLIANCTFPRAADLEEHTCHICQEESLGRNGIETPIKLRCGHVLGMACLVTWTFQHVEGEEALSPGCPFCRAPLLSHAQGAGTPTDISDLEGALNLLANYSPGCVIYVDERWVRTAEELWENLCTRILDHLDSHQIEFPDHLGNDIRAFLFIYAPPVEKLLSFGTVQLLHGIYTSWF